MRNLEVSGVLKNIANLLDVKGENPFRVRAYREAAQHIAGMAEDIDSLREEGRLRAIPGVGESLASKIEELLGTGRLRYYEELKKEVPEGLSELTEVPGLGPRRAKMIFEQLGVANMEELERAAEEHRLSKIPGIREKTEAKILREVRRYKQRSRRLLLGVAFPAAEQVASLLRGHPAVQRIDPAGSIRRMQETIGDIDILVSSEEPNEVMDTFVGLPIVKEVLLRGSTKSSILTDGDLQIDIRVIKPEEYGSALQYFTGSKAHNIALRDLAIQRGLKLSEYGIFEERTGRRLGGQTEDEVYRILGMDCPPPELRTNRGEIQAALKHRLPKLVEEKDIRGDLHTHSDWSDGTLPLEAMAEAARQLGYEYIAVTDHSSGLGVAHGLTVERARKQRELVERLNARLAPFRILHGVEVEIKADGSLDFDDQVLSQFDIVTASVHSGFGQPIDKMTARILRAIRNPFVDLLNHPTGRLLGRRAGFAVDLEVVTRAAAEAGTTLEINGQPERLDLDDVWARRAIELGVTLASNSDAHNAAQLGFMRYSVATARRAWVEKKDLLNTLPLASLLAQLRHARRAA